MQDFRGSENFNTPEKKSNPVERLEGEPTFAFVMASWLSMLVGVSAYLLGLYNAGMQRNEKGYYLAVIILGLYSAVSLQKAVRDKDEGVKVTGIYYGISWLALLMAVGLMGVGLYNAGSITLSEKGFYGISFVQSVFSAVVIQKNIRDTTNARDKANKQG